MRKVQIISTGGTIASMKNERGKLEAGRYSGEDLARKLGLPEDIDVTVESSFQKPSVHMTFDDLHLLAEKIKNTEADGIVITHGTDTLEESAYYLDLLLHLDIPVVFTGSQRSPDQLGSDAFINLRHAVYTAADPVLRGTGVTVVFNERIFSAEYVKKEHASNVQGFNSFGFGYLGIIDNDKIHLYQRPVERHRIPAGENRPLTVVLIKAALEEPPLALEAAVNSHVDGIVIEALGRGQVPPEWAPWCSKAVEKGIPVVLTTASEEGHVYTTYDYPGSAYDLYERGVVLGRDADSKKARLKLRAALLAGVSARDVFEP
ncbi:asparaginase [Alkalicoccus urumqiensis]|uniref:asparaginase n=1 Tax=Alkalicoccus urumqiensis TaxID=1548213 RepID=A0A2P6MKL5_ALKUR|nr:asparaginase [Alkalicoccus urumqiensis]PRO66791.1 asparaginase [Alkalicoccus urumqiensis]